MKKENSASEVNNNQKKETKVNNINSERDELKFWNKIQRINIRNERMKMLWR